MRIRVMLVLLIPALLLLLTVWLVLRYFRQLSRCRLADQTVQGIVTKVISKAYSKELYKFTALVRYEADGQTYEKKNLPYPENTPDCPIKEGDTVTVHYPAGHPEDGFVRDGMRAPAESRLIAACCAFILLFVLLLITDSLVRYATGWFTLPERKLIGAVRLGGMVLLLLGMAAAAAALLLSRRRAVPATGTVREVKQYGRQTAILAECLIGGEQRVLFVPKEPADKREYAAGDSIVLRVPRDASQAWIDRKQGKGTVILNVIAYAAGFACILSWLIGDLLKLLKM